MLNVIKLFMPLVLASFTACAHKSVPSLAESASPGLQTPKMLQTPVGKLAVWLTTTDNASQALPVLVLWPSVFSDKSIYLPLVEQLRGKVRLVLIDGPGHGASEAMPAQGFSMKDCAVAVKTIMDELGIRSATVGGTSWGGLVGGEFALLYPQHTDALVMLNTPVFAEPGIADRMIVLGMRLIGGTKLFSQGVAKGFFMEETRQANGATIQEFHRGIEQSHHSAMADAVGEVLVKREALAPRLSAITAPTLFVVGQYDDMYPAARLEQAARTIPKLHYHSLPTKHISVVDQPQTVGKLIEALIVKQ